MTQDKNRTDVYIHLPSYGFTSLREVQRALERIIQGVPTWTDVRLVREAVALLGDRAYEN